MKPVIVSVPTTLLVLASVGGATAQITSANSEAIAQALWTTSAVLAATGVISGDPGVIAGTLATIAITLLLTKSIWPWRQHEYR